MKILMRTRGDPFLSGRLKRENVPVKARKLWNRESRNTSINSYRTCWGCNPQNDLGHTRKRMKFSSFFYEKDKKNETKRNPQSVILRSFINPYGGHLNPVRNGCIGTGRRKEASLPLPLSISPDSLKRDPTMPINSQRNARRDGDKMEDLINQLHRRSPSPDVQRSQPLVSAPIRWI